MDRRTPKMRLIIASFRKGWIVYSSNEGLEIVFDGPLYRQVTRWVL
jgi:hypothetical protein